MVITPIHTHPVTTEDTDILLLLDKYLPTIEENSVVAVTSKVVSICEGNLVKIDSIDKDKLIAKEAAYFLPRTANKYNISLTIKGNIICASAGIDESNGNGYYVLWPKNPQKSANQIRSFLKRKFGLKSIGVIITDSKTSPMRWGTTGVGLAYTGFMALKDYIGSPDIFNRTMHVTKSNVMEGLAAVSVLIMGEGNEQTPLAVVSDLPFVDFVDRDPTIEELKFLLIDKEDDVYGSILSSVPWHKGKGK
jgi:dihydrofolate synthase / folylpolyglutamate synthase